MDTNRQITDRYGHLLDKYLDSNHVDYETRKKREEEGKTRYGHLLDYAKPDGRIQGLVAKMEDDRHRNRIRLELERKDEERDIQARLEGQVRKERERRDRNSAMVEGIMARKDARAKAAEDMAARERMRAEQRQKMYESIDNMMEISPGAANALANAIGQCNAFKDM